MKINPRLRPAGMTKWGWIPTVLPGCFLRERENFLIRTHVQRNLAVLHRPGGGV